MGGLKFGIDSSGNYGYIKAGADSVTPFSGKLTDLISQNHLSPYFAKTVVQAYALFEYDANSGYMKLTRTGTGKCTVYGGILVDVTKYKSIKLTVKNKSVSNGTISVGISKNSSSDSQEFYSESTGTTVVFDLTSYSGNYYIGIRNFAFNSSLLIEKLELS